MSFELWDIETRNMIGVYDSEAEALQAVRESVEIGDASGMALVMERDDGSSSTLAAGADLLTRASALHV
ncbi:MAG: hypothetical protein ACR2OO_08245 [Thermomicrobiales bacterium]